MFYVPLLISCILSNTDLIVQLPRLVWPCDPMDYSTPDLSVLHYLPKFAQIYVHWCHPAFSSSATIFSCCLQSFPASRSFPMSQLFASGGQSIGVSASKSVLPMNIQDWFPLGWTGWISLQSKGLCSYRSWKLSLSLLAMLCLDSPMCETETTTHFASFYSVKNLHAQNSSISLNASVISHHR